jgi:DNA-binding transcriptional LysR family regulator
MFKDLNDIRLFAAVAKAGSVTQGAAQLGTPVATVSRRLSALEQEVGARLIERSARHFKLTELGQIYVAAAARIVEDINNAGSDVAELAGEMRGPIRISATAEFSSFFLAEPIAQFSKTYPDISISMDLSPRLVNLIDEGFDLAIRIGELNDSRLIARKLITLGRSLYASREYMHFGNIPQSIDALSEARLVTVTNGGETTMTMQRVARPSVQRTISIRSSIHVNSVAMLTQLVIAGAGIGRLPDILAAEALAHGKLVRVLPEWQAPLVDAHLLYPSRTLLPRRVRTLIEHLLLSVVR